MGWDGSISIATLYGPWVESRWGRDFRHPSRPAVGPTQPPVQWVPGLSRGVKRPGRGINHPRPSNAEVKERVQVYLYSTSGPSWPYLGWTSISSKQCLTTEFLPHRKHCFSITKTQIVTLFRETISYKPYGRDLHWCRTIWCNNW